MLSTTYRNDSITPASVEPANRLASVFDRFFNEEFFAPLTPVAAWSTLPLSMWQDEQNLYVQADMPGLTDKDIDVCVQEGELIVRGERKCERQGNGYDNRRYGRFEQRIGLPTDVDSDRIEAKLANGVLSLCLPKCEAAKPRKIAIQSA